MEKRVMATDFIELTEIAGDMVSQEQVDRIARRYYWAGGFCKGKDVLEVACGSGQGLGHLALIANTVVAGDYSEPILNLARNHYGNRIQFDRFDAQYMPFKDSSFDVILIFEALYYIPDPSRFFVECKRVLRPGGVLLISNANKDLFDFNPSPHSYEYHGVLELERDLSAHGFNNIQCFGDTPLSAISLKQYILRPAKAIASKFGLIPKSMTAKKFLKRFVFGNLVPMPAEIDAMTSQFIAPTKLRAGVAERSHKVIFCHAYRAS